MRAVEHQVDGLQAVPVDGVGSRGSGAGRSPCRAFRRAAAGRAARPPGRASARPGASRRRWRRRIRPRPRPARAGCPRRACGRRSRSGRPEAVEPVDHVPFEELLRGVQQDLPRGPAGVHPDQVHRVLQLVAEAEGPAGLVETRAAPRSARPGPGTSASPGSGRTPACWSRRATVSIRLSHHCRVSSRLARAAAGSRYLRMSRLGLLPVIGLAENHDHRALAAAQELPAWSGRRRSAGRPRPCRRPASPRSTMAGWATCRGRPKKRPRRRLHALGRAPTWPRRPARCGNCCADSRRTAPPSAGVVTDLSGPACSGWSASTIWK